jgi:hypothetical protein
MTIGLIGGKPYPQPLCTSQIPHGFSRINPESLLQEARDKPSELRQPPERLHLFIYLFLDYLATA